MRIVLRKHDYFEKIIIESKVLTKKERIEFFLLYKFRNKLL